VNVLFFFFSYTVSDPKADGTEPVVAMETQPLVEPAKAADTAKREMSEAEAKETSVVVEMKDKEERGGGGEDSKESRTVFVSNLLFTTTEKELEEKFSEVRLLTGQVV